MSGQSDAIQPKQTPRTQRIIAEAADIAAGMGHSYLGTEHLLLALVRDGDAIATQAIAQLVEPKALEVKILEVMASKSYNTSSSEMISRTDSA